MKRFKTVLIRRISEQDNTNLNELMKIFSNPNASKILLMAASEFLLLRSQLDQTRAQLRKTTERLEKLESLVSERKRLEDELTKLVRTGSRSAQKR